MYTGIVQASLPLASIEKKSGLTTFSLHFSDELLNGLETGGSVAINGVCFTVTKVERDLVYFDAIQETIELTNIKHLEKGTIVNVERSAKADAEIGGHPMSGHVIGTVQVKTVKTSENNCQICFQTHCDWIKYVFHKGFLALNGASLTVADIDKKLGEFSVSLIPETLKRTNFSLLAEGDEVNVEVDHQTQVIVDTVSQVLNERIQNGQLSQSGLSL